LSRVTAPSANAPMRLSLKRIEAQLLVLDQTVGGEAGLVAVR
jgi:hypothetical protein